MPRTYDLADLRRRCALGHPLPADLLRRLADAGISYPWDPLDALAILDERDALAEALAIYEDTDNLGDLAGEVVRLRMILATQRREAALYMFLADGSTYGLEDGDYEGVEAKITDEQWKSIEKWTSLRRQ